MVLKLIVNLGLSNMEIGTHFYREDEYLHTCYIELCEACGAKTQSGGVKVNKNDYHKLIRLGFKEIYPLPEIYPLDHPITIPSGKSVQYVCEECYDMLSKLTDDNTKN
jgi:hypothetical protein